MFQINHYAMSYDVDTALRIFGENYNKPTQYSEMIRSKRPVGMRLTFDELEPEFKSPYHIEDFKPLLNFMADCNVDMYTFFTQKRPCCCRCVSYKHLLCRRSYLALDAHAILQNENGHLLEILNQRESELVCVYEVFERRPKCKPWKHHRRIGYYVPCLFDLALTNIHLITSAKDLIALFKRETGIHLMDAESALFINGFAKNIVPFLN